jgi:hypothetical protein
MFNLYHVGIADINPHTIGLLVGLLTPGLTLL